MLWSVWWCSPFQLSKVVLSCHYSLFQGTLLGSLYISHFTFLHFALYSSTSPSAYSLFSAYASEDGLTQLKSWTCLILFFIHYSSGHLDISRFSFILFLFIYRCSRHPPTHLFTSHGTILRLVARVVIQSSCSSLRPLTYAF